MKLLTFGIALTILGIIIMAHAGSNLVSSKRAINKPAPTATTSMTITQLNITQWAPVAGLLFFASGIGFVVYAKRGLSKFSY